jgi:hypothetical protein
VYIIHESKSKDVYLALLNDGSSENYASECESDEGGKGTHGREGEGEEEGTSVGQCKIERSLSKKECAHNILICVFLIYLHWSYVQIV